MAETLFSQEWYEARSPQPQVPIGTEMDAYGLGPVKVTGIHRFPLCSYDLEFLTGPHAGKRTQLGFEHLLPASFADGEPA